MANGKKTGGRVAGTPNKLSTTAKDTIAQVAHLLGGGNRLVAWCKEDPLNERAFWTSIYPKLLPLQVTGEDGGPLDVRIIELVAGVKG